MKLNPFVAAALSAFIASAAAAQTSAFDNAGAADTALGDLEEAIADERDRDLPVFGTDGRQIGAYGSVALRFSSTTNDGDDSTVAGVGMRYGTFDGVNGFDVNLSFAYSADNGVETENRLLAGVDYRRNFGQAFFAYAQADLSLDNLTVEPNEYTQDLFVGAGVGYRIINDNNLQWSVQAGPGYRLAELGNGDDVTEAAASISSNLFYALTDTIYVTNDTDVIYSDFATTISNDLALNVAINETLSLRTSYATRFNDLTDDTFSDGENTLGASIVYNFN